MKITKAIYLILIFLLFSLEAQAQTTPSTIVVDHQSVAEFSRMPDNLVASAASLRLMLRHASVGGNIDSGLNSLSTQNTKYNRSNWSFQNRGNPGWQPKVDDLVTQSALQWSVRDVLTMKFCYIDNADPATVWNYYRNQMEQLMSAYPNKTFIWWTMPIMTTGDANRDGFNNLVRAYAQTHNIVLFDIAAIESHAPQGNAVRENGYEAMYAPYSSDGGHLNALGAERVAQALWVLMARISGWGGPDNDWPQLGHDPQKTSASTQTVNGPYRFYWRWTGVAFASRVQPVVVDNRLFIGGLNGTFYAVDADADNQGVAPTILWQRDLKDPTGNYNSPIRSSAGVDTSNNTVIVGTHHGIIYGLDTLTGNPKWTVKTDGAILASPVITNGTAYLGSSDGNFYSISTSNGNVNWKHAITDPLKGNIPILGSATTTPDNSRVFFVAENVKAYALATTDGHELWNQQLQGQSGADRWPVVLNDTVVFRTQSFKPHSDLLGDGDTAMDTAGAVLPDWNADWNTVRPQIVNRLTANPVEQTFFVFDVNTGQSKGTAPVLYTYGNSDPPAPPLVYNNAFYLPYRARHGIQTDGGSVHVTSRYDAELGRMDPATLDITGLNSPDQFTYQFRMTSDEPAPLTIAGDLLLVDSWERLGGIKLTGSTSGNLVYIAMSFASGSCNWGVGGPHIPFYDSCPTNDMSAIASTSITQEGRARTGAIAAAGRIFWISEGAGIGAIGPRNNISTISLSTPDAQPALGPLPGPIATPSAQALASYVWTEPQRPTAIPDDLRAKLEQEVGRITSADNHLMPFYASRGSRWGVPAGSYPPDTTNPPEPANVSEGKAFWFDPGEQLYTLSLAYPYLNPTLQGQLMTYIQSEMNRFAPLSGLPYCCTSFDWRTQGQDREPYPIPNSIRTNNNWPPPGVSIQTIYALWAYAQYTGDWNYISSHWGQIQNLFNLKKDTINMYSEISGAIGYARIARHLGDNTAATEGETVAVTAMQNGLNFSNWLNYANTLYPKEGASGSSPYEKAGRRGQVFFGLTQEIGRYLHDTNQAAIDMTLDDLISYPYNTPLWYATRLGLMGERQENSYITPEVAWSTFLVQAYIKGATQDQLRYWLDRPWGLGDLYYIQKLVATIEAAPTASSPVGDVNQDAQINVLDIQACVNHILGIQNLGNSADVNQDGSVDVLDVQNIVNIILGV